MYGFIRGGVVHTRFDRHEYEHTYVLYVVFFSWLNCNPLLAQISELRMVARPKPRRSAMANRIVKKPASKARLDPFTRGVIWGMHLGKVKRSEMLTHVQKKDGSPLLLDTLDRVIARKREDAEWRGEESSAGGRPQELSEAEQEELVDLVFEERGKCKVTIAYCKKCLPNLRRVNDTTVGRALQRAGLQWMQRRLKWHIPPDHKIIRIDYATALLRKREATYA